MLDLPRFCRSLFEHSPQPMIAVQGVTHAVRFLNPAFSRLVGKDASELVGRPLAVAVPEGESQRFLSLVDRVYRTGVSEGLVEQEHGRDPEIYWSYEAWAILGADGQTAGLMIQVTDVTETAVFRKRAVAMNESLILSAIRQHELTEAEEGLNARLKIAIEHKDHFMAVLSHELRTPLTPVLAAVSLLQRDPRLDDDIQETLDIVRRNVTIEARLIDDLLDMTRIERGQIILDPRPVDLRQVVGGAVEVCRPDLEAGGVALEVDWEDGPNLVDADAVRLQQVFWNLLRNAIKFTPRGGHVRIRGRRQGDLHVVVEVSDDGVGIGPDLLPHLFNAFQQGDADQIRRFGGLGLGLAISKTIVELHGGTVTAQSEGKDEGATFSVRLPILAGACPGPSEEEQDSSGGEHPVLPLRILLVEDHDDTGKILRRLLAADGHSVQLAPGVATGLRLAGEGEFDLLICDVSLPDGSGLDLMRTLRQQGSTLPGISLSGYGREQDIARSRESGFATHLTKPASYDVLASTIREATGSHEAR